MSDLCVCMRDVISEFNSEIERSLVFCALMLFLCSILCLMCSGSRFACGVHLAFWDVVFVGVEDDVCSVYVWWTLNVRESSLGVCRVLCPSLLSYSL